MKKLFFVFALVAAFGFSKAMTGPNTIPVDNSQVTVVTDLNDNNNVSAENEKDKAKTTEAKTTDAKATDTKAAKSDGCATTKSEGCSSKKSGCCSDKAKSTSTEKKEGTK